MKSRPPTYSPIAPEIKKTIKVSRMVSFLLGQVTFESSLLTSEKKVTTDFISGVNCTRYLNRKQGTGFIGCGIILAQMQERDPKQVPEIPGVKRGGEFFKGKNPEMAGQELASRRRVEFGETPLDLCLIETLKAENLYMPLLGRDEDSAKGMNFWEPRVHRIDGSVITWRWERQDPNRRDFSGYFAFAGRKANSKFKYAEVPASWTVGVLVPQVVKEGIEAAMRQQDEIAHDYRGGVGPEASRVDEIFDLLFDTSAAFTVGDIKNPSDLNLIAREAETILKNHGLMESKDYTWRRVVNFTLAATQEDRINRVNPLASRVRARAAFLAATEREMIGRSVGTKAEKVYQYLATVRAGIRAKIQMAADALDDIYGLSKSKVAKDAVMRGREITCTTRESLDLEQYALTVANEILKDIQPAPYLVPVTKARIILAGEKAFADGHEEATILRVLGESDYKKFINNSAARGSREKKPMVVLPRVRLAHDLLKQCLNNPRTTDIKVFDR